MAQQKHQNQVSTIEIDGVIHKKTCECAERGIKVSSVDNTCPYCSQEEQGMTREEPKLRDFPEFYYC